MSADPQQVERVLASTFSCGLRLKTAAEVADLDKVAAKRAVKQAKRKSAEAKHDQQASNAAKRAKVGEQQAYQAAKNAGKRVARKLSSPTVPSQEVQKAAETAYLKHMGLH